MTSCFACVFNVSTALISLEVAELIVDIATMSRLLLGIYLKVVSQRQLIGGVAGEELLNDITLSIRWPPES